MYMSINKKIEVKEKTITQLKKEIEELKKKKDKINKYTGRSWISRLNNKINSIKIEIKNKQIKPIKLEDGIPVSKKGVLNRRFKKELKEKNIPETSPRAKNIFKKLKEEIINSSDEARKEKEYRKNDKKVKVKGKKGSIYKIKVFVDYRRNINVSGYSVKHENDNDWITLISDKIITEGEIKALAYRVIIGGNKENGYKYAIGISIKSIDVKSVERIQEYTGERIYNKKSDKFIDNPDYIPRKKYEEVDY